MVVANEISVETAGPSLSVQLSGHEARVALLQFFIEEGSRRSFGITGFLISGGSAGAISCWFAFSNFYVARAPHLALRLLLGGSALSLSAVVAAFIAAITGYKAFETAARISAQVVTPHSSAIPAERWQALTNIARVLSADLTAAGGSLAFAAFFYLAS